MKKQDKNSGKIHSNNKLNDLTGKQWIKFTKSWFILNPPPRKKNQIQHPAKFPEKLIEDFIKFFTKTNQWVLDPFLGVGSTLLACEYTNRNGIGLELFKKYIDIAKENLSEATNKHIILEGDILDIDKIWKRNESKFDLPKRVSLIITSPPYWNMLKKSRGNVKSTHKERLEKGLEAFYSDSSKDFGNITEKKVFLNLLSKSLINLYKYLEDKGYLVVIIQNFRDQSGEMKPIAWDLAKKLSRKYIFKGEKIWCQSNKKLGIWGYPSEFVSNVHHHYCLIFKKVQNKR